MSPSIIWTAYYVAEYDTRVHSSSISNLTRMYKDRPLDHGSGNYRVQNPTHLTTNKNEPIKLGKM
jgi:hypothetical protein